MHELSQLSSHELFSYHCTIIIALSCLPDYSQDTRAAARWRARLVQRPMGTSPCGTLPPTRHRSGTQPDAFRPAPQRQLQHSPLQLRARRRQPANRPESAASSTRQQRVRGKACHDAGRSAGSGATAQPARRRTRLGLSDLGGGLAAQKLLVLAFHPPPAPTATTPPPQSTRAARERASAWWRGAVAPQHRAV